MKIKSKELFALRVNAIIDFSIIHANTQIQPSECDAKNHDSRVEKSMRQPLSFFISTVNILRYPSEVARVT